VVPHTSNQARFCRMNRFLQNEQKQSTVNNAYGSMGLILAMASFAFVMKKFNDIRMHML